MPSNVSIAPVLRALADLKKALSRSFRDGEGVDRAEQARSAMLDQYFRGALEESFTGRELFRRRVHFTILAVGGYGREELCLESDIDLLILFESRVPALAKTFVEEILYPLWDLRFDLGYAVRSLKECLSLAGKDYEVLTSLLDARFICGDSPLFLRLAGLIDDRVLKKARAPFAEWLRETDALRLEAFGDASHMLEPDLKRGIGGLRDVHHMMWLARARLGIRSPRELETSGILSHAEYGILHESLAMIRLVRNHLHFLSSRKNDRLTYDYQTRIAERLGYGPTGGHEAVERFLGDLHEAMTEVKMLRSLVVRACAEERKGSAGTGGALPSGLSLQGGELCFSSAEKLVGEPALMMRIFEQAAQSGARLSTEAVRLVRDFIHLLDDTFRSSEAALQGLLGVLTGGHADMALDSMIESGFLEALLPEFREIRGRVQFDTYHIYPVGRHSLETVNRIKCVGAGKEILLSTVFSEIKDLEVLLLAALLHDIGKKHKDHARKGAAVCKRILKRLGLEKSRIEGTAFLVRNHLLMYETATRRDLGDEKVVVQCARKIGTADRLKSLYLLTWADAEATGPRAWNEWIANLVQELFFKVLHMIDQGELATPRASRSAAHKRKEVLSLVGDTMGREAVEQGFEVMSPRYLLNTSPPALAAHLSLAGKLKGRGDAGSTFVLDIQEKEAAGCWELTLLTRDRPGLFSSIAGVLALNAINILTAEIYTWRDGTAVDVFMLEKPGPGRIPREVWDKVAGDLREVFENRLSPAENLRARQAPSILDPRGGPRRPPEVIVDSRTSDFFTVIEVFAHDRVGLLFEITRALTGMGLDIRIAKISTKADQAADTFYVRDMEGRRVEDPEKMLAIREGLMEWL